MKVCYTAIFGNIDNLHEPTIISDGWKYVCYTDRKDIKSDVYEIRLMPKVKNPRKINRLLKMGEFNDVESKVYHDGCFRVNVNLNTLPDFMVEHPFSDCSYEELDLCEKLGKIDPFKNIELQNHLHSLKVANNAGLYCGGLFKFSKPNNNFFDEWLHYQGYCVRDQWILPYLLNKHEVKFDSITWQQALKKFIWEKHVN